MRGLRTGRRGAETSAGIAVSRRPGVLSCRREGGGAQERLHAPAHRYWGAGPESVRSDDDMDSPDLPRHHVIREGHHRIHDPFSEEKLAILGGALRLSEGNRI